MLTAIPASDWQGIRTIVLRQPTRKQAILSPIWGRLQFDVEIVTRSGMSVRSGPALVLEAVEANARFSWPTAIGPEERLELDRLRADGHDISSDGRHHIVQVSARSARNTLLYRTLLHEIGHWVDWCEKVERPAYAPNSDYNALVDVYFARPAAEREAFANRYAQQMHERLKQTGAAPFPQQLAPTVTPPP